MGYTNMRNIIRYCGYPFNNLKIRIWFKRISSPIAKIIQYPIFLIFFSPLYIMICFPQRYTY